MQNKIDKRSSARGIAKPDPHQVDLFKGVGGRQGPAPSPAGGGGYQNICTVLNFSPDGEQKKRDPRLDELREMGLQRVWLDVAEEVGVDAMLKTWRILDRAHSSGGDEGRFMVPMRSYGSYLRFQRNRYIEALNGLGLKPREIREKLNKQLCEQISIRHISRILKRD